MKLSKNNFLCQICKDGKEIARLEKILLISIKALEDIADRSFTLDGMIHVNLADSALSEIKGIKNGLQNA